MESSHMFPFHNRSEHFGKFLCQIFLHLAFNQMVLIFHLDMYVACSIKVYLYHLPIIFSVFKPFEHFLICRSRAEFGRLMGSLLGSFLKYNTIEDFQEVLRCKSI
ncbi:hypothetical protein IGI04_014361 [Brassica rapa subsp. trilocularis]|uniref:Uncharacterized protein n=1 Tax=Brassica rapa subsp. trilocularis TaxID=1813537 RepID=A0ABQ7MLZ5_BRACM|nr:hypothetical protein IGI04_014361 [Brassica rapa subsp. trilocularis]